MWCKVNLGRLCEVVNPLPFKKWCYGCYACYTYLQVIVFIEYIERYTRCKASEHHVLHRTVVLQKGHALNPAGIDASSCKSL